MRWRAFAARSGKELLHDPLSMAFGVGFPVVLLLLISLLKQSIAGMPETLFAIENFAPGMAVFGLSFLSLFLGMLMVSDRNSAFLIRLFASPLTSADCLIGYSLPLIPIAILQSAICLSVACCLGLPITLSLLLGLAVLLPVALLFIGFGLLLGCCLGSSQQVGGIGSILINVAAWLSGTWFPLDTIGGPFRTLCYALPFAHAADAVAAALAEDMTAIIPHLLWVIGYVIAIFFAAVMLFRRKMRR